MKSLTQFTDLGLAEPILRAVKEDGYDNPTPIQAEAIPALLEGRDVLGIAQTGTGKTAAFVLPILNAIHADDKRPAPKTCRVLILSPTRELSAQILENVRGYGRHMRVSSALVVGGLKPGPQVKMLARGCDVVVATPGRLLDLVRSNALRLNEVKTLILDEADQMLDLGFFPAIRDIVARIPAKRQTALLSATMPGPIKALAHDLLTDPKQITVAAVSKPIERIEQSVILTPKENKRDFLLELLSDRSVERSIVFTRTKRGADRVNKSLVQYGLKSAAIHGDKSQGQRTKALDGFKTGSVKILVATDIAARGIDVDDVSHVVNYELPNIPENYVHRIGRTARAGKGGVAVSLCDPSEYDYLRDIERLTGIAIDKAVVGDEDRFLAEAKSLAAASKPKKKKRSGRGGGQGAAARMPERRNASAPVRPDSAPRNGNAQTKPRGSASRTSGGSDSGRGADIAWLHGKGGASSGQGGGQQSGHGSGQAGRKRRRPRRRAAASASASV